MTDMLAVSMEFIALTTVNDFTALPWYIQLVFLVVIGLIVFKAVRGFLEWLANNQKPVETVNAKIVSKRENTKMRSRGPNNQGMGVSRSRTTYYVTFETEDGERTEFKVKSSEYAMLAEGDKGQLTKQGTRYHGFERSIPMQEE